MSSGWSERVAEIDAFLRNRHTEVNRAGKDRWDFTISNGKPLQVSARRQDDWLLLDAPIEGYADGERAWQMLEWNGKIAGPCKFVLRPKDGAVRLRAEISLEEEMNISAFLEDACDSFAGATNHSCGLQREPSPHLKCSQNSATEPVVQKSLALRDLVSEAGWTFVERSFGALSVELENRRGFFQALVNPRPDGGVLATVELVRWQRFSPESRDALALLLLSACAVIRMARAAAVTADGQASARFEVRIAAPPSVALLNRAFAALSVATQLSGREAAVLNDDAIARRYLAIRSLKSSVTKKEKIQWER